MTFCGDLPFVPSGINHHPFENLRRKGHHCHGRKRLSGGRPQKFLPAFGQKLLWDVHFTPGLAETVVAVFAPGEGTQTGVWHRTQQRAGTRRNDGERVRETALPLTSRRPFAGMPGAQATARQRRRDRNGRCKPGVFTHRTVATARNRASGFGGDWQVRQQLPVGVGPDDRMPPGSREPKVSPPPEIRTTETT